MSGSQSRGIRRFNLVVKRYDPDSSEFVTKTYSLEADRFTTVLDALIRIKETQDQTLSMRYSCRMSICGSCAMVLNGRPRLACETNLFSLGTDKVEVGPLEAFVQLKDLATEFNEFFKKHAYANPWLIRRDTEEKFKAEKEYVQTRTQVDHYLDFANCIKCGLCVDACPVSNTNPSFIGPQALSQAYRYNSDSRDEGERERLIKLDTLDDVWGCEYAGACSVVCPKGVDPALAIQLLKLDIMKSRFGGRTSSGNK
ncbi:MAG: succinate dehydrogenase iron-sulfur subunit [Nitrososphaerota archaeon]|jgi:succinate dehydrogenase / fumarate reductase iron-sulfur subunit|nr:succinate dehydrogenase iron-sulfur subunit [Nitrososphaerota archaeon]